MSSFVPPTPPFSISGVDLDYFATQAHYRSLASRIVTALGGFTVVVVTGDPLPSAPQLSIALGEAAGRHTVISFSCGPEQGRGDALLFRRTLSASLASSGDAGEQHGLPALVVFDDADRLSDPKIEEIFQHVHQRSLIGDHRISAAIFLARPKFLARLERSVLRFWLAKNLLVARLRFQELGVDEVPTFIRHQLPTGETQGAFNDEAVAAIASVSAGDPMVINRFLRRMLDSVAASTGDALVEANVGSDAVVPMVVPVEECGVTPVEESSRQNPRATQLSTRMWRDRGVRLKLCAGALFCLACVAAVTVAVHMHPANESIVAHSGELPKDTPTKVPDRGSLTSGAASPEAGVAPSVVFPAGPAPTAAKAVSAPGPEEVVSVNTPALRPSLAPARSTAEVAAPGEGRETIRVTAIPAPTASPTEGAPISTAGPPPGRPTPSSTISVPGSPPAQLRIPTAEIPALLARGDALFALGDISSARLFYERAVDAGEARAAIRLGNTFDQAFLDFAHLRIRGDSASAESWYGRARDLGAAEAEILLQRLKPRSSR